MRTSEERASERGLWIGLALGVPIMAWGVRGLIGQRSRVEPLEWGRWIVGSALVHDALVIPAVVIVGTVLRRRVAAWAWPALRWALATSAIVAIVGWPFVRGYGRRASNPSLLPRDYGAGVLVALAVVWVVAAAMAALAWRRERAPT